MMAEANAASFDAQCPCCSCRCPKSLTAMLQVAVVAAMTNAATSAHQQHEQAQQQHQQQQQHLRFAAQIKVNRMLLTWCSQSKVQ